MSSRKRANRGKDEYTALGRTIDRLTRAARRSNCGAQRTSTRVSPHQLESSRFARPNACLRRALSTSRSERFPGSGSAVLGLHLADLREHFSYRRVLQTTFRIPIRGVREALGLRVPLDAFAERTLRTRGNHGDLGPGPD